MSGTLSRLMHALALLPPSWTVGGGVTVRDGGFRLSFVYPAPFGVTKLKSFITRNAIRDQ
jgi:hypothetical protein